jgi:hypothetical protein
MLIRHPGAIALGLFFAGVTCFVVFKDVLDGAAVTTQHVLSLAAIVAAIGSGHMALPELKSGRVVSAAFLGVLFLASTGYVVISSGARNAETAATKAAVIAQANADRARVEAERARLTKLRNDAQGMLAKEQAEYAARCEDKKKAKASNWPNIKRSVDMYTGSVRGHADVLAELPTVKATAPVDAGYAHAAEVIAAVPGMAAPAAEIERRIKLLMPFVVVLIAELGTIAFLNVGLGHVHKPASVAPAAAARAAPTGGSTGGPSGGLRGSRRGSSANVVAFPRPQSRGSRRQQEAEAALLSHLSQHGSSEALGSSNRSVADALGIDRSTLARAAAALARKGVISVA